MPFDKSSDVVRYVTNKSSPMLRNGFECIVLNEKYETDRTFPLKYSDDFRKIDFLDICRKIIQGKSFGVIFVSSHNTEEFIPTIEDQAITEELIRLSLKFHYRVFDHIHICKKSKEGKYYSEFDNGGIIEIEKMIKSGDSIFVEPDFSAIIQEVQKLYKVAQHNTGQHVIRARHAESRPGKKH